VAEGLFAKGFWQSYETCCQRLNGLETKEGKNCRCEWGNRNSARKSQSLGVREFRSFKGENNWGEKKPQRTL